MVHGHHQAKIDLKHLKYTALNIEIDLTLLLTSIIITHHHPRRTCPRTPAVMTHNHTSCNRFSDSTHLKASLPCQKNFVSVHRASYPRCASTGRSCTRPVGTHSSAGLYAIRHPPTTIAPSRMLIAMARCTSRAASLEASSRNTLTISSEASAVAAVN